MNKKKSFEYQLELNFQNHFKKKIKSSCFSLSNNKIPPKKSRGWFYVLGNASYRDHLYKLGITGSSVDERMKKLHDTGVPEKFYKILEVNICNPIIFENRIHQLFHRYRIGNDREFFKIDINVLAPQVRDYLKTHPEFEPVNFWDRLPD